MPAPASSNLNRIHLSLRASATKPRPLVGIFEILVQQHREILESLRRAGSVKTAIMRRERWTQARRQLLSHERAEEQVVYASLDGYVAARTVLEQHGDQTVELELAIADLDATDIESEEWIEQLRDVIAMLADHVRDEENEFFPRAQTLLGENMARELEDPFASAQREVLHALA
jgi:hemerythrin superfamily protein